MGQREGGVDEPQDGPCQWLVFKVKARNSLGENRFTRLKYKVTRLVLGF